MFEYKLYRFTADERTNPSSYLNTSEYLEKMPLTSRLASKMKRRTEKQVRCLKFNMSTRILVKDNRCLKHEVTKLTVIDILCYTTSHYVKYYREFFNLKA